MGSSGRGGVGGTQAAPPPECTAPPRSGGGASKPAGGEICDFASPYFPLHTAFLLSLESPSPAALGTAFCRGVGWGEDRYFLLPEMP